MKRPASSRFRVPSLLSPFDVARDICRRHARSFYFSSFFLPLQKRNAAYAVYAFCRLLDDATDEAPDPTGVEKQIAVFVQVLDDVYAGRSVPSPDGTDESAAAIVAFAQTVKTYAVPKSHFLELAAGCRMDLTITRYATWPELQTYCYRVAGVIGLVMCDLFGLTDPASAKLAVMMGEAMQLTNILRDIKEDYTRGRIYLPAEDLARFGYTEADLAAGIVNEPFRQLMKFEIARARTLYQTAAAGLIDLPADGSRFTASAMGVIYAGILTAIERQDYDVFTSRARLTTAQKILRLPAALRLTRRTNIHPVPTVF